MLSYLNPLPQLSKYKGPYKVGSTEFEIPVSEIGSSSPVPDSRITTVKFRVFYPTTSSATSKKSIPWLPTPQKVWNQAYAQFMGVSERRASWLSYFPSLLSHATIPAVQNAELLKSTSSTSWPVVIFSHGLGGNYNTYSSLLGSLASCGTVCVATEHRDGSSPVSLIKSARDKVETMIPYDKVAHSPTVEVLNTRNAMLRIRLWEQELVYSAVSQMNRGKHFTNYCDTVSDAKETPRFENAFDLRPSKVTWAGHSFGSATTMQFVKSVYYHQYTPQIGQKTTDEEGFNLKPLYVPATDGELTKQITAESPVVLLDLWTMPLRGATTRWLWEKPLPCYDRKAASKPNVIAIMSAEFYRYPDLLLRTRAALSPNPEETLLTLQHTKSQTADQQSTSGATSLPTQPHSPTTEQDLDEPTEPELIPVPSIPESGPDQYLDTPNQATPSGPPTRTPSPHIPSLVNNAKSTPNTPATHDPARLYLVRKSAHLSQSDFGPLFPNLTRYFMKALDPEKTIELNVRGILAMMRGAGLDVGELEAADRILEDGVVVERWERVRLTV